MTEKETQLWQRIVEFEFDKPQIEFNFTDRLARENNWTKSYSKRVIEEYRKFIFLCCISENGATPSDQVDQAWHLHLTFTKSYWIDFCQNTLEKEIHHNPTKGGNQEREKFNGYYTNTKDNYERYFRQQPPADIWPDNQHRFSEINFKRINTDTNWVLKKPGFKFRKMALTILTVLLSIPLIQATFVDESTFTSVVFAAIFIGIIFFAITNKGKGGNNSGCSSAGCTGGCSSHHGSGCSGHGGCSSGCSGCGGGCGH